MLSNLWFVVVLLILVIAAAMLYPIAPGSRSEPSEPSSSLNRSLTEKIQAYVKSNDGIETVVVANAKNVLFQSGPTHEPINTHSVRKSIMSVLYGMSVNTGEIDVHATLADLDINDSQMPLTQIERTAAIADLLKARSGIYIEAAGETPEMRAGRPQRGQFSPGEHYYYNNWDFNTLGTILARTTGRPLHNHLEEFSKRLGFVDYQSEHLFFSSASGSEHDQYVLYLSARDLARVGQLMLRQGLDANGQTLITPDWIEESTTLYSRPEGREPLDGYGYLWSIDEDAGTFWATGWGGQYLLVDPRNDLVVVTRNHTGRRVGAWLWLVALNQSSQAHMRDVEVIYKMITTEPK